MCMAAGNYVCGQASFAWPVLHSKTATTCCLHSSGTLIASTRHSANTLMLFPSTYQATRNLRKRHASDAQVAPSSQHGVVLCHAPAQPDPKGRKCSPVHPDTVLLAQCTTTSDGCAWPAPLGGSASKKSSYKQAAAAVAAALKQQQFKSVAARE